MRQRPGRTAGARPTPTTRPQPKPLRLGAFFFAGARAHPGIPASTEKIGPGDLRRFPTGFEALIRTADAPAFAGLDLEPASIDEILVFTNREGEEE